MKKIEQKDELVIQINRLYIKKLEEIITKYPEQYFWFHKNGIRQYMIVNIKNKHCIEIASKLINDGEIIIYPTDTLYGFGVDAKIEML